MRGPVAVIVSRFPLITETFILREIIEMERQGQPVVLVPLRQEQTSVVHREAVPWVRRALFTPLVSRPILAANLRALATRPLRYLTLAARVSAGAILTPRYLAATLGYFPKSVYLAERLRREGVAHVHAHFGSHPATAAYVVRELSGIDSSFTIHAHDLFLRRYRPLLRRKVESAAAVRVISRFNRDYLATLYPGIRLDHVHVVHVGIPTDAFAADRHASPADADRVPQLICVAAHMPYKGLPVLIDACRLLKERGVAFRCDLIGDGPQRGELESRIRAANLTGEVHLLGARPQHEVRELLMAADVFVLPSIIGADGWMEGIPVALMEAMAAGKPVVATRISGIPELVDHDVSGLLVEPGNTIELADALQLLLQQPDTRRRMADAAPARVRAEFRLDRCTAELLRILDPFTTSSGLAPALADAVARIADGSSPIGVRRLHAGSDSTVAELLVPAGEYSAGAPAELVLKQHRERAGASRPAAMRARDEFEVLQHLRRAGINVPAPLELREDAGILLMQRCPGTLLSTRVVQSRSDAHARPELRHAIVRAGQWLHAFQAAPLPPACDARAQPDGAALFATLLASAVSNLERAEGSVGAARARRIAARLPELAARSAAGGARVAGHHGDFGPGNLLVREDGVCVVDLEGFRAGLTFEDAAYFLVQLELFFARPGSGRNYAALRQAFLEGWFGGATGGADGDAAALRLGTAAATLRVLAREECARGARAWLRRRTLVRMLDEAVR